jgi:hypothetical protein
MRQQRLKKCVAIDYECLGRLVGIKKCFRQFRFGFGIPFDLGLSIPKL